MVITPNNWLTLPLKFWDFLCVALDISLKLFLKLILDLSLNMDQLSVNAYHKNNLETIQTRFFKQTFTIDRVYPGIEQLISLHLFQEPSLETRRKVISLNFLHKLINNNTRSICLQVSDILYCKLDYVCEGSHCYQTDIMIL